MDETFAAHLLRRIAAGGYAARNGDVVYCKYCKASVRVPLDESHIPHAKDCIWREAKRCLLTIR